MARADEAQERTVLARVLSRLQEIEPNRTPPEIGAEVHAIVREVTSSYDPYRKVKDASTREALDLYPRMQALVAQAESRLETAVRLSIAGNIIDYGPARAFDLAATIDRVLVQPFAIDDTSALEDALAQVDGVLMLADNAGETVFDRLLIEELPVPTVYAVKGTPILNDATVEDAIAAGVDQAARVISTGSGKPGTILSSCSPEFVALFEEADLVLAKGQANYETLSQEGPNVFFLLQTKCPVIAHDVGVPVGSIVLKQGGQPGRLHQG